jgi:50S ribosomal subunit-associated GTPase HflX
MGPAVRQDGRRAVDRMRLALRAYEQRAQSRAAVLALWRSRASLAATRP